MIENDPIGSLLRNVLYILLGAFVLYLLFWRGWILGILIGVPLIGLGIALYVRYRIWKAAKRFEKESAEQPSEAPQEPDAPIIDDGRIQVTDLSSAKEVEFEKE